jgi:heme A synthase
VQQDLSPTAHFLVQLRVIHPVLAIVVGAYGVFVGTLAGVLRRGATSARLARALAGLFVAQLAIGVLNLALLAPIPMQIVHLLMADLVWIALVLAAAAALAEPAAAAVPDRVGGVALQPGGSGAGGAG